MGRDLESKRCRFGSWALRMCERKWPLPLNPWRTLKCPRIQSVQGLITDCFIHGRFESMGTNFILYLSRHQAPDDGVELEAKRQGQPHFRAWRHGRAAFRSMLLMHDPSAMGTPHNPRSIQLVPGEFPPEPPRLRSLFFRAKSGKKCVLLSRN
jgi:hypothetical protein